MAEKENQAVELVKAGANVLGQFYQDLAQPSVKALGEALAIVFELCPNSLLSLRLWTEKRKLNFAKRLNEYKEKLEQIPEDKRCEVNPQIGAPIVEKLTYTTNDDIADLFTTLLANASNSDTVCTAHPSFVDIISRLSPDEAKIINSLRTEDYIPYCEVRGETENGYDIIEAHLTLIRYQLNLLFPQNIGLYLSNMVSLGLLEGNRDFLVQLNTEDYDLMCNNFGIEGLKNTLVPSKYKSVTAKREFLRVTPLGKLFMQVCSKQ